MNAYEANQYLSPLAFASLGTVLGAILNKIFTSKDRNSLYWIFYLFAIFSLIFLLYTGIASKGEAITGFWYLTLVSSTALLLVTKFMLKTKNIYKTSELDPVVNNFTGKADKAFINLLCGDMNFFGTTPNQMDNNSQYKFLKTADFKQINVLCFPPTDNSTRIRYGKILSDIPQVTLRYYQPTEANLYLRGRITRFQGGDKLLMYFKISAKTYQAIETDTSNSHGALYKNIWDLIWQLALKPPESEMQSFVKLATS